MSIRLRAALAAASCVAFGHALAVEPPLPAPPAAEPIAATVANPDATTATAHTPGVTPGDTPGDATTAAQATEANAVHADPCCAVPAGSPVLLEILETLSSASAARGDAFRFRLAEPVRLGDAIVIPAGTEGRGEIIHAQRAGSGGKPGELLLAARSFDHAGTQVALRGMKLGGGGASHTTASLAVALVTGPFGLLVRGGNLEIPVGTLAQAKLANALAAGEAAAAPPPAFPSTTPGDALHTADSSATTTTQQE